MSQKTYAGQTGRADLLKFDPSKLRVITDPKHPLYDPRVEREPDESLILNIMRLGVIEPLVIWRDGDQVYVHAGRQRRAAAIEANKRLRKAGEPEIEVPCVWRQGDDAKLFEIAVAENEARTGTSPMERAKKMARLVELGRDHKAVAIVFGCTENTVKNTLALLDCAASVQKAVEAGKVPAAVASKLAKLPRAEQTTKLDEMIEKGATKGAAAHKAVNGAVGPKQRMRSRAFLERFADELEHCSSGQGDAALMLLRFVLGRDDAFERGAYPIHEEVQQAADRAAQKKGKANVKSEEESAVGVPERRKAEEEARAKEREARVTAAQIPTVTANAPVNGKHVEHEESAR